MNPVIPVRSLDLPGGPAVRVVAAGAADLAGAERLLPAAELAYLARDRIPPRRELRVLVRAALREWLAGLIGVAPAGVSLRRAASGRLEVAAPGSGWSVSLSVRGRFGIIAMGPASEGDVGIDIERVDPAFNLAGLGTPAATAAERTQLGALPAAEQRGAFFRLWTRKEAVAKALGRGAAEFDDGLDLSGLAPAETAAWLTLRVGRRDCRVRDLTVAPGYAAAVAVARSAVG